MLGCDIRRKDRDRERESRKVRADQYTLRTAVIIANVIYLTPNNNLH